MSARTSPLATKPTHHWQTHGTQVATPRGGAIGHFMECTVAAHSVVDPRVMTGSPHVVLDLARDPFTAAARLTAASARAIAASLLQAADRVDALAAAARPAPSPSRENLP